MRIMLLLQQHSTWEQCQFCLLAEATVTRNGIKAQHVLLMPTGRGYNNILIQVVQNHIQAPREIQVYMRYSHLHSAL